MQADSGAYMRLPAMFLEGVAHPQRFAEGLRLLAESLGVEQAGIRVWDRRGGWSAVREARRVNQGWHLSADDTTLPAPAWRQLASALEPGRWQRFRVLHDRSRARDTYPRDRIDVSFGLRLPLQNGAEGVLMLRAATHQARRMAALPVPTGALIKSLRSAMELIAQLRQLSHRLALSGMLLDAIRLPLLLIDRSMRLLAANCHGQPMLERTANGAGKRQIGLHGVCRIKFSEAVRSACDSAPRRLGSVLWTRSEPAQQVLVLPIVARHAGRTEQAALVLVHSHTGHTEAQGLVSQLLQQVYGLTPAEARLAVLVLDGQAPGDAAISLKVSVATVRTQLSAILKKTGTRKQAELIRRLSPLMVVGPPPLTLKDHVA